MNGMQSAFLRFFGIVFGLGVLAGGVIVGLFWFFS